MPETRFTMVQFLADVDDDKLYIAQITGRTGLYVLRVLSPRTLARTPEGPAQVAGIGRVLSGLAHPNIKAAFEMGEMDGQPALVKPYFEGQGLDGLLANGQPLAPDRVIRIGLELADALRAAHGVGIFHGALRPSSVILTVTGGVILSEWGCNLSLPNNGRRALYVAPELRGGDGSPNPRSDVWSLGALMFQMLTLRQPTGPDDISLLGASCPASLVDLIGRMLDPDPYARPYDLVLVCRILEQLRPLQERRRIERGGSATVGLPLRSMPFWGREAEVDRLLEHLMQSHTYTINLCGAAGVGKSALALEVAYRLFEVVSGLPNMAWRPTRAYIVRFLPDSHADYLMLALTEADGLTFEHRLDGHQQLIDFLRERSALLVIDDAEHIPGGVHGLLMALQHTPGIKTIVISTVAVAVADGVLRLDGLPVDWEGAPGVQLFRYVARRTTPNFELTDSALPLVARLCQLVGGNALGITLVAGMVAEVGLHELAQAVPDALEPGMSNAEVVRAVLEYAWLTLSPREREIITRLSVVRGEVPFEVAAELIRASAKDLRTLAGRGMLQRVPETGGVGLHPLVFRYAQEWLRAAPYRTQIWQDHSAYMLQLLQREGNRIFSGGQGEAAQRLTSQIEDIRAAWLWAVETPQQTILLSESVGALYNFFLFTLRFREGREWFEPAVARLRGMGATPQRDALMGALLLYAAILSRYDIEPNEMARYIAEAEALDKSAWPLHLELLRLNARGLYELGFGDVQVARVVFEQMLTMALYEHNPYSEMVASLWLGATYHFRITPERVGLERGKSLLKRALDLAYQAGDTYTTAVIYLHLGMNHASAKNPTAALEDLNLGVAAALKTGNRRTAGTLLMFITELHAQLGQNEAAYAAARQQLDLSRDYGHPWAISRGLATLAQLELQAGEFLRAKALCQELLRYLDDPRPQTNFASLRGVYAYTLAALGQLEESVYQARLSLEQINPQNIDEVTEAWAWVGLLTYWAYGPGEAGVVFDTLIERYGTSFSPHHLALVYAGRALCAMRIGDKVGAQVAVESMQSAMHQVVSFDQRGSALLNLLNPRLHCSLVMIDWLRLEGRMEDARIRLYEITSFALNTNLAPALLYVLAVGSLSVVDTAPQQACTWLSLVIDHPKAPFTLRRYATNGYEAVKQKVPARMSAGSAERAKSVHLVDAVREMRTML
ncbi:MAG: hypothetical protein MUF38_05210 [Anaerolineae bacterium]|nr:hypothetical protein [Anaerolineae bacterium]